MHESITSPVHSAWPDLPILFDLITLIILDDKKKICTLLVLIVYFSLASCHFFLGPNLSITILLTHSLCSSLDVRDQNKQRISFFYFSTYETNIPITAQLKV